MKLRDAWRIAKIAATETSLKGNIQMSGGYASISAQQDAARFVRKAKRGLTVNWFCSYVRWYVNVFLVWLVYAGLIQLDIYDSLCLRGNYGPTHVLAILA